MSEASTSKRFFLNELKNKDFRHDFVDTHNKMRVSLLIRHTRERQDLKQNQLAARMGKHPTHITRLENMEYGGYTLNSLLEVFKALDVALLVDAIPFSSFVTAYEDLSAARLGPLAFGDKEEQKLLEQWAAESGDVENESDEGKGDSGQVSFGDIAKPTPEPALSCANGKHPPRITPVENLERANQKTDSLDTLSFAKGSP